MNKAKVYGALMRKPTTFGVPFDYLPVLFFFTLLSWLLGSLLPYGVLLPFVVFFLLWLFGYGVNKFDPDGFKIIFSHTRGYLQDKYKFKSRVLRYSPW